MNSMIEILEHRTLMSKSQTIIDDEAAIRNDLAAIDLQRSQFAESFKGLRAQLAKDLQTRAENLKVLRQKIVIDRQYWIETIKDDRADLADTIQIDTEAIRAAQTQLKADQLAEDDALVANDIDFLNKAKDKLATDKLLGQKQIHDDQVAGARVLAADHQAIVTYLQHDAVTEDRAAIRVARRDNHLVMISLFSQLHNDRLKLQQDEKAGL